jgi:hypothetical protein
MVLGDAIGADDGITEGAVTGGMVGFTLGTGTNNDIEN